MQRVVYGKRLHSFWATKVSRFFSTSVKKNSDNNNKKRKYLVACQNHRASFSPLCVSVDGMLAPEADFFVRRLSDNLCAKWEQPYSVVAGWVRARLSFAILRAAVLCVRGSRTKWRSLVDGASLPLLSVD